MSKLEDKFKDAKVLKQADIAKREGISIDCCLKPDKPLINGFEHELLIAKYAKLEAELAQQIVLTQRICTHPAAWGNVCSQCKKDLSESK